MGVSAMCFRGAASGCGDEIIGHQQLHGACLSMHARGCCGERCHSGDARQRVFPFEARKPGKVRIARVQPGPVLDGCSFSMIFRRYRKLTTEETVRKWFGIMR